MGAWHKNFKESQEIDTDPQPCNACMIGVNTVPAYPPWYPLPCVRDKFLFSRFDPESLGSSGGGPVKHYNGSIIQSKMFRTQIASFFFLPIKSSIVEKFKWILSKDLQNIAKYLHLAFGLLYECFLIFLALSEVECTTCMLFFTRPVKILKLLFSGGGEAFEVVFLARQVLSYSDVSADQVIIYCICTQTLNLF